MVTMDLDGWFCELLGAQTWDQSDLHSYSSSANYDGQIT